MTDFEALLSTLSAHNVAFIVVGGAAAIAHGSARLAKDLPIVYERSQRNLERLSDALSHCNPYLRGVPPGRPFRWEPATLQRGLNFTLITSVGELDLLGEIPGGGTYQDLSPGTVELQLFGIRCLCLSLPQLIRGKQAAGRPKHLEALAELESIQDEHERER